MIDPSPLLPSSSSSPFQVHWDLFPRRYVAPYRNNNRMNSPMVIDGNVLKEEWENVPWSLDFDDIRGPGDAPYSERPIAKSCRTRMKMMWDDMYLYIAAIIESESSMDIRATFHKRNSPIFQQDSDFEVFVDAMGCCHYYKELEMNALNTVWNLMLDKPYWDGGTEHSGRIAKPGESNYYDVTKQKTAARLLEGALNQPCPNDDHSCRNVWAVEIALSHQETLHYQPNGSDDGGQPYNRNSIPKVGDFWRINFSRVEEKGNINWTWQPQRVWDPKLRKHIGKVDMHLPDAWGYLQFGDVLKESRNDETNNNTKESNDVSIRDPYWPAKLAAMNIYYAQKRYNDINHKYAPSISELSDLIDKQIIDPFQTEPGYKIEIECSLKQQKYVVKVITPNAIVSVTNERLMTLHELDTFSNKEVIQS